MDQKIENLLNISLSATKEEREKSLNLDVGVSPVENRWEIIVKQNQSLAFLEEKYPQTIVEELLADYSIITTEERYIEPIANETAVDYVEKPKSIFFELISNGITPILAHPERYTAYYNDLDFFFELREIGVLMQMNASSIVGEYGAKAKKMVVKLLKANLISFVGSDIHSDHEQKNDLLPKIEKKLKKIVGEDQFIEITTNNFARVIRNDDIV